MCAPFIGEVSIKKYLPSGQIEQVICDGENYAGARFCHYEWVKQLRDECEEYNVTFAFIGTGTTLQTLLRRQMPNLRYENHLQRLYTLR